MRLSVLLGSGYVGAIHESPGSCPSSFGMNISQMNRPAKFAGLFGMTRTYTARIYGCMVNLGRYTFPYALDP